jgi:integrase
MAFTPQNRPLRSNQPLSPDDALAQRQLANDVLRSVGSAPSPQPKRKFHGETADGRHYQLRSPRPPEEARQALEFKAGGALVNFWWENEKRPFGDFEARTTPRERHMASLTPNGRHPRVTDEALGSSASPWAAPMAPPAPASPTGSGHPMEMMMAAMMQSYLQASAPPPAPPSRAQREIFGSNGGGTVIPRSWSSFLVPRTGVRISDRIEPFLRYIHQRKSARSTAIDYAFSVRIFKELVGDLELADIGVTHLDTFLDAMRVWPANASKRREYRNMLAPEVVKKSRRIDEHRRLDVQTQQGHINRLRGFFKWLEDRREAQPGLLLRVRVARRDGAFRNKRNPFSTEQLERIFTCDRVVDATEPHKFWFPMLGLYTGMRISEIAQLYVDDIVLKNDIWCIDVAAHREGQRLKTRQSQRFVPIHSRLLGAGFLDYVADARRMQRPKLFPRIVWGHNGPGDGPSDWFTRLMRQHLKITEKGATFHAFRHNFTEYSREALLSEWITAQLIGHSQEGTVMREHYYNKATIPKLQEVLERIPFPSLPHPVYRPRQFDRAFLIDRAEQNRAARLEAAYDGSRPSVYGRATA